MDSGQDRLLQFERDLLSGKNICSSEGIFVNFPPSLKRPFQMKGLGLIICRQGNFQFSLNQKKHFAGAGESLFIPEDGEFQVLQESEDMEVRILWIICGFTQKKRQTVQKWCIIAKELMWTNK